MLQEMLTLLPADAGPKGLTLAVCIAAGGLGFWMMGARFSRSICTLVGVAAGAWLGLRLPRWMGWEIDAMAIAIGGALVLGFAGYLFHTMWVGLTLGLMLAAGATVIVWHRMGFTVSMPAIDPGAAAAEIARTIWDAIPGNVLRTVSIVAGISLTAGGLLVGFWPKLGRVLTYSLLGTLLFVCGGLVAVQLARPQWIELLPASLQTRGIVLSALVMFGAIIQWALLPRSGRANLNPGALKDDDAPPRPRGPRDVRDLGNSKPGPMKLKEARA